MGLKLKKLTEFVGPAPDNYTPRDSLTKPQAQRPINYDANRTDFSKSITGKRVGPGVYEVQTDQKLNLGKIITFFALHITDNRVDIFLRGHDDPSSSTTKKVDSYVVPYVSFGI